MHKMMSLLLAGLLSVGASLSASAQVVQYAAPLLGSSEVPAANTPAHGTALVTIDPDRLTMRVEVSFSELLGDVTAAHIHCCVAPGSSVGVATTTPTFPLFPSNVKAGTYERTFDMAESFNYNGTFIFFNGGTAASAFNALLAGLDAGHAYLDLHTTMFTGGEIRALLQPVPLPATMVLMVPALGVLALRRRQV